MNTDTNNGIEQNENNDVDIDIDAEIQTTSNSESGKGLSAFIVDDDNFLLEMYAKKFKNTGFEIMTATSGEDATSQIKSGKNPNIFIFDLIMPGMDGLELLQNINSENLIPNATKIVLSNQGQQTDIQEAEKIGVDGYIVKALHTPSEVVDMVIKIHNNKNN